MFHSGTPLWCNSPGDESRIGTHKGPQEKIHFVVAVHTDKTTMKNVFHRLSENRRRRKGRKYTRRLGVDASFNLNRNNVSVSSLTVNVGSR